MTRRRAAAFLLAAALHASACHGTATPTLAPAAQPDLGGRNPVLDLQHDIDSQLATPALDRSAWAVLAKSLATGDTLYAANAHKLLMPASLVKLLTLATAADRLGWDYAYETRVLAAGPVASGSLDGDLLVVGSGDPSFDDWDGAASTLFRGWAEQLKGVGVRVITGRIIGDDNTFDDEAFGSGWAWDDLSASFAAGVGALQFNENTARLRILPGDRVGDAATVTILPATTGIVPINLLTTSTAGLVPSIATRRLPGSTSLEVRGTVPSDGGALFRNISVDNPTLYFVTALRDALVASGIEVRGPPVDIDTVLSPPVREQATPLLVHRSPPLSTLATTMMKNSQNLYAETLLKTLGVTTAADPPDGRTVVRSVLESWGIPREDVVLADGSGLSRYNLLTADVLVALLTKVYKDDRLREPFRATLPVAGRDGTLARRFTGTAAEGVTQAKTGSLLNARSLAGYVQSADGEPVVFCILANNYGTAETAVERTLDAIVVKLAEFSRRRQAD